jgi:hypothetical protein
MLSSVESTELSFLVDASNKIKIFKFQHCVFEGCLKQKHCNWSSVESTELRFLMDIYSENKVLKLQRGIF